jgi:hypothetical protein
MNIVCELPRQTFLHNQEAGTYITPGPIYAQEYQNIKETAPVYVLK